MNSDNLILLLQQGFRISLGATASLVETLQDPQKRSESLSKLGSEFSQLAQEWAEKGEVTEQEARAYVDSLLHQPTNQTNQTTSATPPSDDDTTPATPNSAAEDDVQLELQELIAQMAAMRAELENLRSQDNQS